MNLLDLPLELLQAILVHAVLVRGLKRGLRLRLVSRLFASEVVQAVCTSRILEDCCSIDYGYPPIGLSYLQYRILGEKNLTPALAVVRRTAELLGLENGIPVSDEETRRAYTTILCSLAFSYRHCLTKCFQEDREVEDDENAFQKHFFVAAAYTNSLAVVRRLIDQGCRPFEGSSLFGDPFRAAARQGHSEILELLLAQLSLAPNTTVGPQYPDAEDGRDYKGLDKALITPSEEVFRRIMAAREDTRLKGPLPEERLGDLIGICAYDGWTETVRYLLHLVAPANGCRPQDSPKRLIRDACRKGFAEIVQLLLDHSADTTGAMTHAAAGGHLDIVRMLLDHGCDANEGSPPPIVCAVELEHKAMYNLLRERGAILNTPETGGEAVRRARAAGLESTMIVLAREGVENLPSYSCSYCE